MKTKASINDLAEGDVISICGIKYTVATRKWHGNRKYKKLKDTAIIKTTNGVYEVRK